ncbi:MAG: rod shape-determining protein MreC, partial [Armatimonadetes bacterium]|nr:rod shape-determining protein MreC [Armatimonadota bacterium]
NAPRRNGRTAGIVLAALVLFGALYGVLHNRLAASGTTDPAINGVRTAVSPFATGTSRTNRAARGFWEYVFPGKQNADAVARLEKENTRLRLENEKLRNAEAEATRLRAALNFASKQKKPLLSAEIIALLPSANAETIAVGRGTRQGVRVGSVARTADGLLGQVTEVGSDTAQVLLLSDRLSGAGVLVQRRVPKTNALREKATAVVRGGGRGQNLEIVYLPREADVLPGDTVITSGFGGVFPAGIPVGTITEIIPEKTGFVKKAKVEPFAPMPGTLREVFLIL